MAGPTNPQVHVRSQRNLGKHRDLPITPSTPSTDNKRAASHHKGGTAQKRARSNVVDLSDDDVSPPRTVPPQRGNGVRRPGESRVTPPQTPTPVLGPRPSPLPTTAVSAPSAATPNHQSSSAAPMAVMAVRAPLPQKATELTRELSYKDIKRSRARRERYAQHVEKVQQLREEVMDANTKALDIFNDDEIGENALEKEEFELRHELEVIQKFLERFPVKKEGVDCD
ncbi:hypothetical protein M011DRAFT_522669 [Sporormia fimetaria CBS 119925]|uniref:Uncharacterized protein n=1 Tax=Sporormia fimetaria CBS 119925 TaxID=1340428 RepID=A0A6A6VR37_9PLEO|nr:hypothetical protein M011DRAFT_522669 [Sporormia fimetaria CBS 119925]